MLPGAGDGQEVVLVVLASAARVGFGADLHAKRGTLASTYHHRWLLLLAAADGWHSGQRYLAVSLATAGKLKDVCRHFGDILGGWRWWRERWQRERRWPTRSGAPQQPAA